MGGWVYEFAGCPDEGEDRQIAAGDEPGQVLVRERPDGADMVDGFVRESTADMMMVVRFRRVAGGDRSSSLPAIFEACAGLLQLPDEARAQ
ncbi:hypothetical protein [Streptomyces chiangmaiensis]|uniref:Uncharacterized protein n=1 Tax=Streptomyces chiangmaiensis TaxID=766497 RepID=A0ABU7FVI8_9ACTN|nr:hypothetical protein [Streptomyces chiangmaiensis]MED7828125.1 hypothetical protein [Streptomyces chiangmaiensis]